MPMNSPDNLLQVSHIGDYNQVVPDDILLVESDSDYVKICHALRRLIGTSQSTRVWVRQESHFQWLRSFIEQVGIEGRFDRKTPRLILAEKWGVSLPAWLDDELVLSQDLLGMVVSTENMISFSDVMLVFCLGESLGNQTLSTDNLSSIITAITQPKANQQFGKYPVLMRCLEEKCKVWSKNPQSHWVEDACDGIIRGPEEFWRELTLWALLAGYPSKLLEYVISPEKVGFLQGIPLEAVQTIPLHPVAVEQAWSQIEVFFNDISPSIMDEAAFFKVMDCVSGRIPPEFYRLLALIESGQFPPSEECIDRVRRTFKACPGVSSAALYSLSRFVKPNRPTLLKDGSERGARDWITWTVNEYVPYRHWQTLNGHYDQEVEEEVRWFSDWYTNEYVTVHHDGALSLVHVLTQWQEKIQKDQLSIILIIDCLPVAYWDLLEKALTKSGFHRHNIDYRFAPLPTDTEHTKPLLLRGTWDRRNQTYDDLLKERAKADWFEKKAVYLPDLKALAEFDSLCDGTILVLNLLSADNILHSDVESAGSTYHEELHRLFSRLADSVKSLLERWAGQRNDLGLYVVTDHGATMILDEEKSSLDSKVVNKLFQDSKHRFAAVETTEAETVSDNLWALGYRFCEPFSQQDRVYFIPGGHSTVRTTHTSHTYVHGGASPEEVIIPAAEFRPIKITWQDPSCRFLDLPLNKEKKAMFYVCRIVRLRIEVQNRNNEPLRIFGLEVLTPVTDLKSYTTPVIAPMSSGIIDCDCYFAKQVVSEDSLRIQFSYEIAAEEHIYDIRLPVTFRSAITGGFSLKDL